MLADGFRLGPLDSRLPQMSSSGKPEHTKCSYLAVWESPFQKKPQSLLQALKTVSETQTWTTKSTNPKTTIFTRSMIFYNLLAFWGLMHKYLNAKNQWCWWWLWCCSRHWTLKRQRNSNALRLLNQGVLNTAENASGALPVSPFELADPC